jgi:hypothetical protein
VVVCAADEEVVAGDDSVVLGVVALDVVVVGVVVVAFVVVVVGVIEWSGWKWSDCGAVSIKVRSNKFSLQKSMLRHQQAVTVPPFLVGLTLQVVSSVSMLLRTQA